MTTRSAQTSDASAICAIWNAVIETSTATFTTDPKSEREIADLIIQRGDAFIVADQDGTVAGFATFGAFRAGPGYKGVVEHSVYLDPSAQGQGLGRALIDQLSTVARKTGKNSMIGAMSGDNSAAQAFHAKLGFTEAGLLPAVGQKFGKRLDLRLMHKNL